MDNTGLNPEQLPAGYFVAGAFDAPMSSVEIHGDKWCVLGNGGVLNFVDDTLLYGERKIFGFALSK